MSLFLVASLARPKTADPDVWRGHAAGINGIAFAPDGKLAATSGLDGTIRLWDPASGREVRALRSGDGEFYAARITADGKFIVATGDRGKICVFDTGSGRLEHELSGLKGWSADIALSPDGRSAAAWSMDGRILIWDLAAGGPPRALEGEQNKWGMALAWSPDGRILAGGRAVIWLWNIADGKRIGTLSGHRDFVRSLAFSSDGKRLASASLDKTIRVWDVENAAQAYVLEPEGFVHASPSGPVSEPIRVPPLAVAFSPDGKMLATAGADRLVSLWDAATGKLVRTFQGQMMTITALAFSPDGKTLVTASLDKTVRVWQVDRADGATSPTK